MANLFGEAETLGKSALVGGLKTFVHGWGALAAAGVTTLFSQWDHHQERMRIKHEYENEIGAMVGKKAHDVNLQDMELAAKKNPVIKEALHRSTLRRNLSIGVTLAATALVLAFVAPAAMSLLGIGALTGGTHALAAGAVGALSFLGVEKVLEKVTEKKFGLSGPDIKQVEHKPALQSKLAVPDQITYLKQLRHRGGKISEQQVMTVMASANPTLAKQITALSGTSYDKLSEGSKRAVLERLGEKYNIAELTDDLNNRHMRVQELAFTAYGQSSGVGKFESPRVQAMQQRIDELTARLEMQNTGQGQGPAFARSGVSGTVLGDPDAALTAGAQQDTTWQRRMDAQRQQQSRQAALA